jgi:serine/threonine-protein kinase
VTTAAEDPQANEAPPLRPGDVVGRHRVAREVGRGGMCNVYEAVHIDLQKRVALKLLKPAFAADPTLVERFLREGRAASKVRHRHAVDVFDVGAHGGLAYLVMEFLEGEDLARRLRREGSLTPQETADLLLPVMAALVTAHEEGVVHRDLKPANIFLAVGRHQIVEPRVVDFGISKLFDEARAGRELTATDMILGTPYYMSPEQVKGARSATPASDQYALGVILYQCVTGEVPFRGPTLFDTLTLIVSGTCRRPRELCPSLTRDFEAVIGRAMARDPARRFASVGDMAAALVPFASPGVKAQWSPVFLATDVATAAPAPAAVDAPPGGPLAASEGSIPATPRELPAPLTRPRWGALLAGGVVVAALAAVGVMRLRATPAPPSTSQTTVATRPPPREPAPPATEAPPPAPVFTPPPPAAPAVTDAPRGARTRTTRARSRRGAPRRTDATSGGALTTNDVGGILIR